MSDENKSIHEFDFDLICEYFSGIERQGPEAFLRRHAGNPTAEGLIANERREAELYARFKEFYGYVFYIGRKR